MFDALRKILTSKDSKRVMLSFVLQNDECSRMLGEFAEQHLPTCSKLIIVWRNGSKDIKAVSSESLDDVEACGMLRIVATNLERGNGI